MIHVCKGIFSSNVNVKIAVILLSLCGDLGFERLSAAPVEGISSELLKQVGEDGYWVSEVSCMGARSRFSIRQKLKQDDWCLPKAELPCEPTKSKLAEAVCNSLDILVNSKTGGTNSSQPTQNKPQDKVVTLSASAREEERAKRIARIKLEQDAKEQQEQKRIKLLAALDEEKLSLLRARALIESEKKEVALIELRLDNRGVEIERELQALQK